MESNLGISDAVLKLDYAFVAYTDSDSNGDWRLRNIPYLLLVADGQPSEIEMLVQLRKANGGAEAAKSVKFP